MPSTSLVLTTDQRSDLEARVRSGRGRADAARRARVILLLAEGCSYAAITTMTGCSSRTIALWKQRFAKDGLAGLAARHRGSKPTVLTPALEARIMTWTRRPPPHGATHWSTRSLGRKMGVQHTIIARAWRHAGLHPHRLERYMRSTDPEFETKAADVIGLYLDPPQHAVVFCIDEKTAIQALDRLDPVLPLSPGRAERHGFEYYRHGTLSLYAALNTRTGEVVGHTAARHTSAEFVGFLRPSSRRSPDGARCTSSWTISRPTKRSRSGPFWWRIRPSISTTRRPTRPGSIKSNSGFRKSSAMSRRGASSPPSPTCAAKLMRYIKHYNKTATPIRWAYADPSRRIA
jgi:transposase